MRLHFHPLSPYSRKAMVAVRHRGDPVALQEIDPFAGGLRTPEFLALSPYGKMPVLETPEGPICESTSIIEYLEEQGPALMLPPGQQRLARHWDRLADLYLMEPMAELFWRRDTPLGREAPAMCLKTWGLLEQQLVGRDFVCGEGFSLGDLSAAIASDYLVRLGLEPPARVAAWLQRCLAVPAMAWTVELAEPHVQRFLKPLSAEFLAGS